MDEKDIEKLLRDIGKEKEDYPADLKFATKTDFELQARGYRERKGCRRFIFPIFVVFVSVLCIVMSLLYAVL